MRRPQPHGCRHRWVDQVGVLSCEWRPARGLGERPGSLGLVPVYFRMPRKRFLSCPSPQVQVVTITPVRPDKLHNVAGIIQGVGSPDRHRGVEVSFLCFRCYHRSSERRRGHHLAACTGLRAAHGAVFSIPGDSPSRPGRDAGGRKTWAPGCARPGFAEWPAGDWPGLQPHRRQLRPRRAGSSSCLVSNSVRHPVPINVHRHYHLCGLSIQRCGTANGADMHSSFILCLLVPLGLRDSVILDIQPELIFLQDPDRSGPGYSGLIQIYKLRNAQREMLGVRPEKSHTGREKRQTLTT